MRVPVCRLLLRQTTTAVLDMRQRGLQQHRHRVGLLQTPPRSLWVSKRWVHGQQTNITEHHHCTDQCVTVHNTMHTQEVIFYTGL